MAVTIHRGDCREVLRELPADSVHTVVTSPPYFGLRDYGVAGQIGLEPSPEAFVAEMVAVFRDVRRVLRKDGTAWLNLGDSYAGSGKGGNPEGSQWSGFVGNKEREKAAQPNGKQLWGMKPKDIVGIPWRVAFALQADGWYLRQDIIWSKPNPMPESVRDRCTKAHEYLFLLSKSERYYYDGEAIKETASYGENRATFLGGTERLRAANVCGGGLQPSDKKMVRPQTETRNRRSVWEIATAPFSGAHFATFPPALIEPCILAGCPKGGTVLDPFGGAGTTGLVASRLGRNAILIELNPEYAEMARRRIHDDAPLFADVR